MASPVPLDVVLHSFNYLNEERWKMALICKQFRLRYYSAYTSMVRRMTVLHWTYNNVKDRGIRSYCLGEMRFKNPDKTTKSICVYLGKLVLGEKVSFYDFKVSDYQGEAEGIIRCLNINPKLFHQIHQIFTRVQFIVDTKVVRLSRAVVVEARSSSVIHKLHPLFLDHIDLVREYLGSTFAYKIEVPWCSHDELLPIIDKILELPSSLLIITSNPVFDVHMDYVVKNIPLLFLPDYLVKLIPYGIQWSTVIQLHKAVSSMGDFTSRVILNDLIRLKLQDARGTTSYEPKEFIKYHNTIEPDLCKLNYHRNLKRGNLPEDIELYINKKFKNN